MKSFIYVAFVTALSSAQAFADSRELDIGDGRSLVVKDAGFVVVQYNDEGFGLSIEPFLNVIRNGDVTKEAVTEADLRDACAIVLQQPEARIGSHPPDFIFFQTRVRSISLSLIDLSRNKTTYFETRTNRCRLLEEEPIEPEVTRARQRRPRRYRRPNRL